MVPELSFFLAFGAGLLSFLSPCVLPLLPSFLSIVGGVHLTGENLGGQAQPAQEEAPRRKTRHSVVRGTLAFILGFSAVFAALGVLFSGPLLLLSGLGQAIDIGAGIIVIVLGLNILFNFLRFLNYEKRFHAKKRPRGLAGSCLAGAAFGAGWSPCVGPILGSILFLAGQSGSLGKSLAYLAAYSAGLGLPFLGAAFFLEAFIKRLRSLTALLPLIQKVSGIFLVFTGFFILTGRFKTLTSFFQKNGFLLAAWAEKGGPSARLVPGILLLAAALLPPALFVLKKKRRPPLLLLAACGLLLLTAAAQCAGLIDFLGLLSAWFLYQGV